MRGCDISAGRRRLLVGASLRLLFLLFAASLVFASPVLGDVLDVSWLAPTTNEDGTPLQDLSGYRIYYGAASATAVEPPCNSIVAEAGGATNYHLTGLDPAARYYVRITAYDVSGNESTCSEEASAVARAEESNLYVVKFGTGSGTVTSNPAGISCGIDCGEAYALNTGVTLTASPAGGSTFEGWGGPCTGTGSCVLSMSTAQTATATFNAQTAGLTVTRTGTGTGIVTSAPAGISCGTDCSESYALNTRVTLTATAVTGSTFAGWSGPCTGTGTCAVAMDAAKTATAMFNLVPQTAALTVTKSGSGSGTVTSVPAGISCGTDCSESYSVDTSVTLTVVAATGSAFAGWGGACAGSGACIVTMSQARAVTATFNTQTAILTVTSLGTGSGTITSAPAGISCGTDCSEAYSLNIGVTLTASASSGSTFAGWSGGCTGTGSCTLAMGAARNVTATFNAAPQTADLTVDKAGTGSGTVTSVPAGISCGTDCTETYALNANVTLTPSAAAGSVFAGWTGVCAGTTNCTVVMSQARTVTATFNVVQVQAATLSVTKGGTGSGTVASNPTGINCGADCSESYTANIAVTLTPTAASGSAFAGWSGACSGKGSCTVTMSGAKTVKATFKRRAHR